MNRKWIYYAILIAFAFTFALAKAMSLTLAAGFNGGTYFEIGKSLNLVKKFKFSVLTTKGSIDNVKKVSSGVAQLGLSQIDILTNSVLVDDSTRARVKVLLPVYREEVHVITRGNYNSLKDLKDKTVSIGENGSGIAATANIIFVALKMKNQVQFDHSSTADGLKKLKEGDVDAVFIVAGAPVEAIKNLDNSNRFIPIKGAERDLLTSDFFPYRESMIPSSMYSWFGSVQTISVSSVIIASSSLGNKMAANLIKGIFKKRGQLAQKHPKWRELNRGYAISTIEAFAEDAHPAAFNALQSVR